MTTDPKAKRFREWAILDAEHTRALRYRAQLDLPLSAWTKEDRSDEHWVEGDELAKMQAEADEAVAKLAARMRVIENEADELAAKLRAAERVIATVRATHAPRIPDVADALAEYDLATGKVDGKEP